MSFPDIVATEIAEAGSRLARVGKSRAVIWRAEVVKLLRSELSTLVLTHEGGTYSIYIPSIHLYHRQYLFFLTSLIRHLPLPSRVFLIINF